ncbi:phage tail family protein [Staphylococcus massiliensis]|uniref:phage tail domain-containing protein n=1 Tax=Staphylococcus massiliensis TaxID=555791 RepID=UPI001EDF5006|nr:phage tail family protein [Staphylococcus massiliensis]
MDLKITKKDGTSYTLQEHGFNITDVNIQGIELEDNLQEIDGLHGYFDLGATFKGREISVPFSFKGENLTSFPLMRNLIYELTTSTEPFYIQEMRRPQIAQYTFKDVEAKSNAISIDQYGKETVYDDAQSENENSTGIRYLVRLTSATEITQKNHSSYGSGELTFSTCGLPFGESIGTSLDLHDNGLEYTDNPLWSYGMGLSRDPKTRQYRFSKAEDSQNGSYYFYYAGNVANDQFNQYQKITFKFNEDLPQGFAWRFNGARYSVFDSTSIKKGDVVEYNAPDITKNGLSIINHTNFVTPSIQVGYNEIKLLTDCDVNIDVDCRFYYL